MKKSERDRIKEKILSINPDRWWGDDFDIRFYLISKLKSIKNESVLDIGGGIGIISSEINDSNTRVNLDFSFQDLKTCNLKTDKNIQNICGAITNFPFEDSSFHSVISSSVLQYAKNYDIKNNQINEKDKIIEFPSVEKSLGETYRVLKPNGKLYLVTPNNAYYKSYMLSYDELKNAFSNHFSNFKISFYNTLPRLSKKHRKLNLANVIPKLRSKLSDTENIFKSLLKNSSRNNYSITFFVEANRD